MHKATCTLYSDCEAMQDKVDMTEDTSPPPATIKKEGKSNDLSSMVELPTEISNRFIHDFEATIHIAKQCKATPCHKPSFSKEGLGGLYI